MALQTFSPLMFPHSCTITHGTDAVNPRGGSNPSAGATTGTLACSAEVSPPALMDLGDGKMMYMVEALFFFPADPAVLKGEALNYQGRVFEARGPSYDDSGTGVLFAVKATAKY